MGPSHRARWGLVWLALVACAPSGPQRPRDPVPRRRPDKASLYGDPGLVPSRAGEHARAELALSGELEALLRVLDGVEDVRVEVALRKDRQLERSVIVLRFDPRVRTENEMRARVDALASATLPPGPRHVEIHPAVVHPGESTSGSTIALAMVFMGLGLSLGVSIERLVRRRV